MRSLHDDVGRVRLEHLTQLLGRIDRLVGGDLDVDLAPHVCEPGDVPVRHGLLHPVEVADR